MEVRNAMFAGSWYPSRPSECEKAIREFLQTPAFAPEATQPAVGGIVPHAGWYFSGAIACNVIHALAASGPADTLVLFGMHLHPSSPNIIMTSGAWETPFGPILIDTELAQALARRFPFKVERFDDFTPDNTVELQLPFIKHLIKDAQIVPVGVPPNRDAMEIGKTVAQLATQAGRRIQVLGSTDLTHYGDNYGFIPKGTGPKAVEWVKTENDRRIVESLLALDPLQVLEEAETRHNACCAGAAAAAVAAAKALGAARSRKTAYATSFDKSPGTSFVGYVGIVYQQES